MISLPFLRIVDELGTYHHTDCIDETQQFNKFCREWEILETIYPRGAAEEVCSHLFVLARRGLEILADLTSSPCDELLTQIRSLHVKKNAGYSGGARDPWKNFRAIERFGVSASVGCLTRLSDKYSRFTTVIGNSSLDKVGESAQDTLLDFISYCLILICLLEEEHPEAAFRDNIRAVGG